MRSPVRGSFLFLMAVVLVSGAVGRAQGSGQGPDDSARMGEGRHATRHPPFEQTIGGQGRWWNNPRLIERLKLTEDQRKTMDQILFDHREKLIDLVANLERAQLAMEPLMNAEQPDQAAIKTQIDKIVDARAALERANARFLLDIRMKLTADQWKQLRELRSERMRMHEQRMDGMHRGEQGGWTHRPNGQSGASAPDRNAPASPQGNAPATQPQNQ